MLRPEADALFIRDGSGNQLLQETGYSNDAVVKGREISSSLTVMTR